MTYATFSVSPVIGGVFDVSPYANRALEIAAVTDWIHATTNAELKLQRCEAAGSLTLEVLYFTLRRRSGVKARRFSSWAFARPLHFTEADYTPPEAAERLLISHAVETAEAFDDRWDRAQRVELLNATWAWPERRMPSKRPYWEVLRR